MVADPHCAPRAREVLVVGAGIQGLMAAIALQRKGHRIRVVSAGGDPRQPGSVTRSSTGDGESGRFITLLEGHPYLGESPMYPGMSQAFDSPVSRGGWLGQPGTAFRSQYERDWLLARRESQSDLGAIARTFAWYVGTSRRAMSMWHQMFAMHPRLFEGTSLHRDGVLRLYDSDAVARAAAQSHTELGVLDEVVSPGELAVRAPHFAAACSSGQIAGALRVHGFTLGIRAFVRNAIGWLERTGVTFAWGEECVAPVLDSRERVQGLRFARDVQRADDYVIACGAYAGEGLLANMGVSIGGLAGRWLLLPMPPSFSWPTKAHFSPRHDNGHRRPVVDLNFTPYYDAERGGHFLAIGGGYLHVGTYPFTFDAAERRLVDAEIERAVQLLMPDWFASCESSGRIVRSDATCVRSLTPDDRPSMVCRPTDRGGHLMFHAGLNTGTTTMAPAIAASLADFISTADPSVLSQLTPGVEPAAGAGDTMPAYIGAPSAAPVKRRVR